MRVETSEASTVRHAVAASLGANYYDPVQESSINIVRDLTRQRRLAGNPIGKDAAEQIERDANTQVQFLAIQEAVNQIARDSGVRPEIIADRLLSEEASPANQANTMKAGFSLVQQRYLDDKMTLAPILDTYKRTDQRYHDLVLHSDGSAKPIEEYIDFEIKPAVIAAQNIDNALDNSTFNNLKNGIVDKIVQLQTSLIKSINESELTESDAQNVATKIKQEIAQSNSPALTNQIFNEANQVVLNKQRESVIEAYRQLSSQFTVSPPRTSQDAPSLH